MLRYVVAIAEVYKNEGNNEYSKKNFDNAIHFYTEGIKVNCKDEDLNAKLYSNRSAAHLNLGKKNALYCILFIFVSLCCWRQILKDSTVSRESIKSQGDF